MYDSPSDILGSVNGLRIKTDATATGSIVENVVYENNVLVSTTKSFPKILHNILTCPIRQGSRRSVFS